MNALLPIITTLASLVAAFFMDRAFRSIRISAAQNLTPTTWFLGGLVIAFVFVAILLASAWIIRRPRTPRWVGLLIAALSLISLGLPVAASGLFPSWENIIHRPLFQPELLSFEAAPNSFFIIQTIALLISGLWALIRPKQA